MAKGYWINFFRAVKDPDKVTEYVKLAGPVMQASGAKFLVRGNPTKAYEAGLMMRTVVIELKAWKRLLPPMTARATRPRSKRSATAPSATCASSKASSKHDLALRGGLQAPSLTALPHDYFAGVTRQITLPTSSATSSAPALVDRDADRPALRLAVRV